MISDLPITFIYTFLYQEFKLSFSVDILQLCMKEELLFRIIPFQFFNLNKDIPVFLITGIVNAVYWNMLVKLTLFRVVINITCGIIYSFSRKKYSTFEFIIIRYFLIILLLDLKI